MASRHVIPAMLRSDIGSDDRAVIPRFLEPPVIEFVAGKALSEFMTVIAANKSIKICAAAGAGKSVRMPTEVFRAFGGVVVHCVPSMLLAVSLHDYILSLGNPDVPISLCSEVIDEYPTAGLVFTSSATFVGQCCRWKSLGLDPGVILYMDECHESDSGTAVIRTLRHILPGVAKYAESSATPGTGDSSSAFVAARLPSTVTEVKFPMPPPSEWNMMDTQVPWSLKRVTGDILVFTDDDDEADHVMEKFVNSGLRAFRLTGRTSPEKYRRVMADVNSRGNGQAAVLVLDYTFRSGFSFPTVTRIIDLSRVRFFVPENNRTVAKYRPLYNAEVYQTKNRGGRIKGMDCHYFRSTHEPENVQVHLEGAEASLACLWYRMLGFEPPAHDLHGVPTFSGKVPKNMLLAMAGHSLLTCYNFSEEWPGKSKVVGKPEVAEPMVLDSPIEQGDTPLVGQDEFDAFTQPTDISVVIDDSEHSESTAGGRPPSIFSLGDDVVVDGVMTEADFVKAHRKSVKAVREKHRVKEKPLPVPNETLNVIRGLTKLRDTIRIDTNRFEMGTYYWLRGFNGDIRTEYFPDGIAGLANAAHDRTLEGFTRTLTPEVALEAKQRAILDLMKATVKYRAVRVTLDGVYGRQEDYKVLDPKAMTQWFDMVRDIFLGADITIRQCFMALEFCQGDVMPIKSDKFCDEEKAYIETLLNVLRACVASNSGAEVVTTIESGDIDAMHDVMSYAEKYPHLGGRVNMRITGKSLRERLANAVLGNKPVEVDAVLA